VSTLEHELRGLASAVEFPPEGDFATLVAERLRREPAPPALRLWSRRPRLVLAIAIAGAVLGAAFAVPQTRAELLDLIGIGGATIERTERDPTFDRATLRRLGVPVSPAAAQRAVGFELFVPAEEDVTVTLDRSLPAVTFSWNDRRLLLTEFRGETTPFVQKSAGPGTRIDQVIVRDQVGYWLTGDVHAVVFRDGSGRVLESRAAGNVLLWEEDGVTLRLEGARSKSDALAIAGTLRRGAV
jgi:hypothetical protein